MEYESKSSRNRRLIAWRLVAPRTDGKSPPEFHEDRVKLLLDNLINSAEKCMLSPCADALGARCGAGAGRACHALCEAPDGPVGVAGDALSCKPAALRTSFSNSGIESKRGPGVTPVTLVSSL